MSMQKYLKYFERAKKGNKNILNKKTLMKKEKKSGKNSTFLDIFANFVAFFT